MEPCSVGDAGSVADHVRCLGYRVGASVTKYKLSETKRLLPALFSSLKRTQDGKFEFEDERPVSDVKGGYLGNYRLKEADLELHPRDVP